MLTHALGTPLELPRAPDLLPHVPCLLEHASLTYITAWRGHILLGSKSPSRALG